jgi:hypothetical protein
MRGQWIGRYTGSVGGEVVVNVDECSSHYQGLACLIDDNRAAPRVAVRFRTPNKNRDLALRSTEICVFDPASQQISNWDAVAKYFPGWTLPAFVDVKISWTAS